MSDFHSLTSPGVRHWHSIPSILSRTRNFVRLFFLTFWRLNFPEFQIKLHQSVDIVLAEPERMRGKIKDFSEFQVDIVFVFVLKLFLFFSFSTALPEPEKISLKSLHIWDLFSLSCSFLTCKSPPRRTIIHPKNTTMMNETDFFSCPTRKNHE